MLWRASLIEPDRWFHITEGMGVLFGFVLFSELTVSGTRGGQDRALQPPSSEPANKNTLHENKHRAQLSKPPSLPIIFPCIWTFFFLFFFNRICRSQPFPGPQSRTDSFHVTTSAREAFSTGKLRSGFLPSFPFWKENVQSSQRLKLPCLSSDFSGLSKLLCVCVCAPPLGAVVK